tara:strand:+ start:115 stop:837 length:723 start_codon:yes stop_codon:yes gene_type:complete
MSEEKQTVYQAITKVQGALAKIGISKDRTADTGGRGNYKFRGIDDIYNAIAPLLSEYGLCILPRVMSRYITERQSKTGNALFCIVVDMEFDFVSSADGSKHTVKMLGEAMDSGDKATNKAMSAAYKYACLQTFCIPTEGDNDSETATHEVVAKSIFKNASLRNTFAQNVIQSFEQCETEEELKVIADLNKDRFSELKASGNEHDLLVVEESQKRYKAKLMALKAVAHAEGLANEFSTRGM